MWTTRLMLENLTATESTFVTLTYSEETVPCISLSPSRIMTLVPRDLETWLKRYRKAVYPARVRYFAVGEYGTKEARPHYHVALFGAKGCIYEDSRLSPRELCDCNSCVLLRATWPNGFVHQGTVELKSMQYLCSYMLKGMYRRDDARLKGREPEFRRMSLRPGIGGHSAMYLADALRLYGMAENPVLPATYRFGQRLLPIGKYLRQRVRVALGRDKNASVEEVEEAKARMQPLYEIAARFTDQSLYKTRRVSDVVLYKLLVEANREKARQVEAREKIFNRGK